MKGKCTQNSTHGKSCNGLGSPQSLKWVKKEGISESPHKFEKKLLHMRFLGSIPRKGWGIHISFCSECKLVITEQSARLSLSPQAEPDLIVLKTGKLICLKKKIKSLVF